MNACKLPAPTLILHTPGSTAILPSPLLCYFCEIIYMYYFKFWECLLSRIWEEDFKATAYLSQRLSVATQLGNAISIMGPWAFKFTTV